MFLENVTNGRCDFTLKHLPCWAICFSLPFPCFSAHAPQWNLHVPAGSFSYTAVRKLCALGNTTRHAILLLALVGFNTFGLFIDSIDIPLANRSTRPEIDMALCIFCRIPLHVSAFCENLVCRGKWFQMNQCQQWIFGRWRHIVCHGATFRRPLMMTNDSLSLSPWWLVSLVVVPSAAAATSRRESGRMLEKNIVAMEKEVGPSLSMFDYQQRNIHCVPCRVRESSRNRNAEVLNVRSSIERLYSADEKCKCRTWKAVKSGKNVVIFLLLLLDPLCLLLPAAWCIINSWRDEKIQSSVQWKISRRLLCLRFYSVLLSHDSSKLLLLLLLTHERVTSMIRLVIIIFRFKNRKAVIIPELSRTVSISPTNVNLL